MADVEDYSTTAASNTTDFTEGQAPSTVNNAGRETQADIAAMYQRQNAIITVGGTADALTATFSPVHSADVAGRVVIVQAASANTTTTPTFQLDSLTARTITKLGGSALVAGDIQADAFLVLKQDVVNAKWELLNPSYTTLALSSVGETHIDWANSAGLSQVSYSQEAYSTTNTTFTLVEDDAYIYIPANAITLSYHGIGYSSAVTCEWYLKTDTNTGTTAQHGTTPSAQTGTLDVSDKSGWTKISLYLRISGAGPTANVYRITGTFI